MWPGAWPAPASRSSCRKVRGSDAHFPDAAYAEKGATAATRCGRGHRRSGPRGQGPGADARGGGAAPRGHHRGQLLPTRRATRHGAGPRAAQGDGVQPRPRAPDQPGPVDGRAVVAGDGVGLSLRAGRGGAAAEVLPHVHDRGGHHPARQGPRARRRGGRTPGHRHRPSARGPGAGLRRPGRRQRRGAVPRRQFRGARARVPGGRGRLRPGAVRGVPRPPARADQQRGRRRRRGHHHRGGARDARRRSS